MAKDKESNQGKKKLYYISAEFLIGKLLSNNMINLGIYDTVKNLLEENGKSLSAVEETEPEPSLGNGGLGRLAACFLDSIATLGLNGDGVGLNYHFGLFKQLFKDNKQAEEPNPWIENTSWLTKTDVTYKIPYKHFTLTSRMYDIEVTGYNNRTNKLHLFDVETVDESIVEDGISFDKTDIAKNLTLFLYPDDSDKEGRILRIYQQYFMVSNAARLILDEAIAKGSTLYDLADYAVIQINDTHPTMVIPELIRLLTTEHGMEMDDAIEIVSHCCAYTNHTILAEALEKWPVEFFKEAVPQLLPIMEVLDDKVRRKFDDPSVYIIDKNDLVHMAHIDIHYGFSVNGVASLHTDILKETELNNFYKLYPEKFNNKTNGITFRRWLLHSNPELTDFITSFIGDGFKKDAEELKKLNTPVITKNLKQLYRLLDIKAQKKAALADYLEKTQGITINPDSIFDIQIKRLHEYKRQQMNALYLIHKYLEIKKGKKPTTPITAIFGAKAAPAYIIAKDIIHMILCLQQIIKEKPPDYSCPFILSTIHASKGLEYDTVYLLDVIDGILPDQVSQNPRTASKEELESYEEERRLFYVGITRAKNQLNVFTMKPQSSDFCDELFGRKVLKKPMEIPKRAAAVNQLKVKRELPKTISDTAYQAFLEQLGVGMVVEHKRFGEGVITGMPKGKIRIAFEEGTKSFQARALAESGMLKL